VNVVPNKAMLYKGSGKEQMVRSLALWEQLCERGIPNRCKRRCESVF
jgi:hypothetical protein